MTTLITIENKGWGALVVHHLKIKGARLEWRVGRDVEIYVKGPATDCYDLMAVTAITEAHKLGFTANDVRCQNPTKLRSQFTTKTKGMF